MFSWCDQLKFNCLGYVIITISVAAVSPEQEYIRTWSRLLNDWETVSKKKPQLIKVRFICVQTS